jgi:hypothetical protein
VRDIIWYSEMKREKRIIPEGHVQFEQNCADEALVGPGEESS